MSFARVPFSQMDWIPAAPLEKKKASTAHGMTLLEFSPGFSDPNWCENGHYIQVLTGSLEIQFADTIEVCAEGDAIVIDRGTRHRARNPGEIPTQLFIVVKP